MISRRDLLQRSITLAGTVIAAPFVNRGYSQLSADSRRAYSTRTIDVVRESGVIDMLGLLTLDWRKLERWRTQRGAFTKADFTQLRQSCIDVFHPAVSLPDDDAFNATLRWLDEWEKFLEWYPEYFVRVKTAGDLDLARGSRRIGVILGMQDSTHFRSPEDVRTFYARGQRVSQLTYNSRNRIGTGCAEQHDEGLTEFGAQIVTAMQQVGMAVDVSHCGLKTTLDTFEVAKKKVLITHSNCRALVPGQPRCKPDEIIRKLAATGGVMGITGVRCFVSTGETATLDDTLNHFDHVAKLVGVEHVGLGSDTDVEGSQNYHVPRLNHPYRIYELTEGFLKRGYTNQQIGLILGGNFRRVLNELL